MNRWSALMLDPMALFVIPTGRGDDRCSDKRAGRHLDRFGLELAGDLVEQRLVQTMGGGDQGLFEKARKPFARVSALEPKTRRTLGTILCRPAPRQA